MDRVALGLRLAVTPNDDLDVTTQLRQHPHEPLDRHVAELAAKEARHIGLAEPHPLGGFDLCQISCADDLAQAGNQPRLQQMGFMVGVAHICKNAFAAALDLGVITQDFIPFARRALYSACAATSLR